MGPCSEGGQQHFPGCFRKCVSSMEMWTQGSETSGRHKGVKGLESCQMRRALLSVNGSKNLINIYKHLTEPLSGIRKRVKLYSVIPSDRPRGNYSY